MRGGVVGRASALSSTQPAVEIASSKRSSEQLTSAPASSIITLIFLFRSRSDTSLILLQPLLCRTTLTFPPSLAQCLHTLYERSLFPRA